MGPMSTDTAALVAALWVRFQPLAGARVGAVADFVAELASVTAGADALGLDEARERAIRAVHDLVGSLGSYGRPEGSVLAARLETLLEAGSTDLAVLRPLVQGLEEEVAP